jgi:hypothetical protein
MAGRLRRHLVDAIPEPTLRRIQRLRHRENPRLSRPARRSSPGGVTPETVAAFDAHAVRGQVVRSTVAALESAELPFVLLPDGCGSVREVAVADSHRRAAEAALQPMLEGPGWLLEHLGRRWSPSRALLVRRVLAAPSGQIVSGPDVACQITFWTQADGVWLPARPNCVVPYLSETAWQQATRSPTHWPVADPKPSVFEVREPIDIVYTWVDGSDPEWQRRKAQHEPAADLHNYSALHSSRFTTRDELRYSLRSVAMFANWVRKIHIVTDGQVPPWLDVSHPKINVVDHREIFTDPQVLPVFNSHAIESQLHHIPDLTERYLYFNDDLFLGRPVEPDVFFHGNGIAKFFLSPHTLDLDPPSVADLPVTSAAKNNRALLERDLGLTVTRKFRHGVHPQLRSVLVEMEKRYPDVFQQVAASRFRHPDDLSIPTSLHHYYAYAQGRAVPGTMQYRYQDIGRPNTARRLDEILRERPQVFCLNEIVAADEQLLTQYAALAAFLAEYFPLRSPFEVSTAG